MPKGTAERSLSSAKRGVWERMIAYRRDEAAGWGGGEGGGGGEQGNSIRARRGASGVLRRLIVAPGERRSAQKVAFTTGGRRETERRHRHARASLAPPTTTLVGGTAALHYSLRTLVAKVILRPASKLYSSAGCEEKENTFVSEVVSQPGLQQHDVNLRAVLGPPSASIAPALRALRFTGVAFEYYHKMERRGGGTEDRM